MGLLKCLNEFDFEFEFQKNFPIFAVVDNNINDDDDDDDDDDGTWKATDNPCP